MTPARWALAAMVVALVVAHFVLRVGYGLGGVVPNLLVIAVLLAAREMRPGSAAGLGLLLGLLEGSVVAATLGASALVLVVLGYLGARSREWLESDGFLPLALYLFVGKWLYDALLFLVLEVKFQAPPVSSLLLVSPLAALYAALVGTLVMAAYRTVA